MQYRPEGSPFEAKYVIVGEAPAKQEVKYGKPFQGMSGHILNDCLERAGIGRFQCYLTNVFDFEVKKVQKGPITIIYDSKEEELWKSNRGFTNAGMLSVERLAGELSATVAPVVCPMGAVALDAICRKRAITKWRGSIIEATMPAIAGRKCIPAIHPANALHGQAINQYVIGFDLKRMKTQSEFPEIRRPRYNFYRNATFRKYTDFLKGLLTEPPENLAVDIEVNRSQCSRICFTPSATPPTETDPGEAFSVSIPYGDGNWSAEQEVELWQLTSRVLKHKQINKIFQNGIFDIQFLFMVHNILVEPPYEDTMIAQSILYPEFPKGLAFLTSIYTHQPYYKDMVKHGDIDKKDG